MIIETKYPKKRGRPPEYSKARQLIHQLKAENPWAKEAWIKSQIAAQLEPSELPSDKTIERYADEVGSPGPLDVRWSLAISHLYGIRPEANGYLLAVWKESLKLDKTFTVRQALWATRLNSVLQDNVNPQMLLAWATLYSAREKLSEAKKAVLYTDDLDAELAFWPYSGEFPVGQKGVSKWEYDQAVRTGTVPITQWWKESFKARQELLPSQGQGSMEHAMRYVPWALMRWKVDEGQVDFFVLTARGQLNVAWQGIISGRKGLRQITKEQAEKEWEGIPEQERSAKKQRLEKELPRSIYEYECYLYAEGVMIFWLRKIARSVEKWKGIEMSEIYGLEEPDDWHRGTRKLDKEDWDNMCWKLAEWVIKEAQHWSEKEGAGYHYLSEPSDILREFGIDINKL